MDYLLKDNDGFQIVVEKEKERVKEDIIGQYIKLRKEKGLTQEDIANLTGIARTNIVRIEGRKNVPTIEVLTKLAIALNMELEIKFAKKGEGRA